MKDPAIIVIGLVSVVVAAVIIIFAGKNGEIAGDNFGASKDEAAKFEISNKFFFLSPDVKMKQKDIQIGNSGTNPVYLFNFSLSEGIKIKIITTAEESPEIIGSRKWQGTLNPNGGGVIRVSFLDEKINWQYPADQYIRFETNDPNNSNVEILFTADTSKIPPDTNQESDNTKNSDNNENNPAQQQNY